MIPPNPARTVNGMETTDISNADKISAKINTSIEGFQSCLYEYMIKGTGNKNITIIDRNETKNVNGMETTDISNAEKISAKINTRIEGFQSCLYAYMIKGTGNKNITIIDRNGTKNCNNNNTMKIPVNNAPSVIFFD